MGEGWEANKKYHQSIIEERRTNPLLKDGDLDPKEFGKWTKFASCLKDVMFLVEGQAMFPETQPIFNKPFEYIDTNRKPVIDDGTEGGQTQKNDHIIAGSVVGSSKYASENSNKLFEQISGKKNKNRTFHGAGLRFNEKDDGSDALIKECAKWLPSDAPEFSPNNIQASI